MIPRFIDLPYLEPMVDVLRLEELKFSSYPQAPQLHEVNHCHYKSGNANNTQRGSLVGKNPGIAMGLVLGFPL